MKRTGWIVLSIGALLALFLGFRLFAGRAKTAARNGESTYARVRVARGTLAVVIEATGKVAPAAVVDLSPPGQGNITEILVEPGDNVAKGQVLARLDAADAEIRVSQAEDALAVARARLRAITENAAVSPTQAKAAVDRCRAAVASAKSRLDQLRTGPPEQELIQARAAVAQAETTLVSAKADLERMQRLYEEQAATKQQLEAAEAKYQSSLESLKSAQAKLDLLTSPPRPEDLAAAEASYSQAQADLAVAEENLRTSGLNDQVVAAQAEEKKARDNLTTARRNAAATLVQAPFDGMIIQVYGRKGGFASPEISPILSMASPGSLIVEADVDENDIAQVALGMPAAVTMTALPDREYEGRVISIGGLGQELNGIVTFKVKIALLDPGELVKPGMSADVAIKVQERRNVLYVPNAALETRAGRVAARMFKPGGGIAYRLVTTGLRTDTVTEIVSGLRQGEFVAVLAAQPQAGDGDSRRGMRMFFGGPRGGRR